MLRDYLAAMAMTRVPSMPTRIVLLLASIEADQGPVAVSQRDVAMVLQLQSQRHMRDAFDWLVDHRLVDRLAGEGSRPAIVRLRPPEDWLEPGWTAERKSALAWVA